MNDAQLAMMSVKDLRELRANIDAAIRAAIRSSRTQREPKVEAPVLIDLERERDAWTAARKSQSQ